MKLEPERYSHLIDKNGHAADSPSPFAIASLELDKKALAAFMGHLKRPIRNAPSSWFRLRTNPGHGGAYEITRRLPKAIEAPLRAPASSVPCK